MTDPQKKAESSKAPRLTIRKVLPEDAAAVATLSGQLGYEATAKQMAQRIAKLAATGDNRAVFVACLQDGTARAPDRLVGWIDLAITHHLQSEPCVLIGGLVVQDGLRGAGIGKRLCEQAEAWTRSHGINVLRVTSRSTRPDAHRFYLRDGYTEVKTSKVFEKVLL